MRPHARNRGERLRRQRGRLPHGAGDVEGPFKAGDVRQVRQVLARLEAGEEIGEVGAVLDEATRMRRMLAQVFVRGVGEEALVDQAADDREGALQGIAERGEGVMAVDPHSCRRIEPVALDGGDDLGGVTAQHGSAEPHLQLKQHRHIGAHGPALRRDAPRPAGPRAREGWCPTRSAWARGRSAGAPRRRAPRPACATREPWSSIRMSHVLGGVMAGEVDLADRLDGQCLEIGDRVEPEILTR